MVDLDTLTEAQGRELYNTLAARYARAGKQSYNEDETMVWDAINEIVGQRRALSDVLAKCGKEYTRASYADDVEYVCGWLDNGCGVRLNKPQRMAVIKLALDCLGRQLLRAKCPLIHKTMIQQLLNAPAAVDRAFPGYASAGLLDRVVALA